MGLDLDVGEEETFTFTDITSTTPGLWEMYALVDWQGMFEESNEANNVGGPAQIIWGSVAGITVTSPNGGEAWESGTTPKIKWDTYGTPTWTDVKIEYSIDGGANWDTVVDPTTDDGKHDWLVPPVVSGSCLVRVTSVGASPTSDESDGFFSIHAPVGGKPNLTITSLVPSSTGPRGDQPIEVVVSVTNNGPVTADIFYVDLFYDRSLPPEPGEGRGEKSELVASLASGASTTVTFAGVASASARSWQMYALVDPLEELEELEEGDNAYGPVQVTWERFWIALPAVGDVLVHGETYLVVWNSYWSSLPVDGLDIDLSTVGRAGPWTEQAGGLDYTDGLYLWTVPTEDSTDSFLRVSDTSGPLPSVGGGPFTIHWGSLQVTHPNGGESVQCGKSCTVAWNSTALPTALVDIELSTDLGATWSEVAYGVPNNGSHDCVVSCKPSNACLVRISNLSRTASDVSDGAFTVRSSLDFLGGGCGVPLPDTRGHVRGRAAGVALLLLAAACLLMRQRRAEQHR
ncbi:MAG: CARDB domain-containing protein [Planctomycetota bacterium]|jgi:hypothetical protein